VSDEPRLVSGICQDCGAWTAGQFVRGIPANSGPGVDVVTHGIGQCPGARWVAAQSHDHEPDGDLVVPE